VQGASTCTNYQVLPGDRIFIAQDHMIAIDSFVNKMLNPFERIFGTTLLGAKPSKTSAPCQGLPLACKDFPRKKPEKIPNGISLAAYLNNLPTLSHTV